MSGLSQEEKERYAAILQEELIPAMGCTEPIAIAYAASVAGKVLGEEARRMELSCSGNIIKNVKAVAVPNAGGQKGIAVAGILGLVGGNPEKQLEVIADVTDSAREKTRELEAAGFCKVLFAEHAPNLYIAAKVFGDNHTAEVIIEKKHTNISHIFRDEKELAQDEAARAVESTTYKTPRDHMNLKGILAYAEEADLSEVREALLRQVKCNLAISQEGLDKNWGANIGSSILETFGSDVKCRACARAAAGSDARMSGCPMPVVINSGSGNQGITVSMPVVEYARELQVSEDRMLRALIVSNLVSIYIKKYIGALSAFCGAVSASCGAGAGISFLCGGDYAHISRTITNTLGNVGGIVCDGAKPSCAAKIASSLHAAILAHHMSMSDRSFRAGEGIVEDDVEETIKNMGYIGRVGMRDTDKEILRVMTNEVNVDDCV